jgi:Tol biopolymer transport system component/DNA-binding winged helix-turn-helix (wHTH) protein
MSKPAKTDDRICFGIFELDPLAGELRKSDRKIRIQEQPFRILVLLLERPGETVSRDYIIERLWPDGTFVDYEHSVNTAIRKLREALGDDPDSPRFVETVPRRGYRFIAPLNEGPSGPKTIRRKRLTLGIAFLCALIAVAFFWLGPQLRPPRVLRYRQLTADRQQKGMTPCTIEDGLATDGPRVFFSETTSSVAQVSSSGGEVIRLTIPFPCFPFDDISPDKAELLGAPFSNSYAIDEPYWNLSIASGQTRRLGNLIGHAGSWSPDGQTIAYATGNDTNGPNDIYTASKDGNNARKLVRIERGGVRKTRWSPDGRVLRMIVSERHSCSLWEISTLGAHPHPIELFEGDNRQVCDTNWTADGRYSLFTVERLSSSGTDIWMRREARSGLLGSISKPVQLTTGPISFSRPTPSPDGKQIFAIGSQSRGELVRYDLKRRRLEPYLSGISAEHPAFSRDGEWVTYVTFPEGILWRSRVDGNERMQLTTPPLRAALPSWSPDRKRIAFAGQVSNGFWKIYVVSADGGKPEMVAEEPYDELDPTWTPDGNSLIFGGALWSAQTKISSVDLRTGRISIVPKSDHMFSPRVSPDGRFIVAIDAPGDRLLYLFNQQTQKWSQLLKDQMPAPGWVQWSADGTYVYFILTMEARRPILYRISITDRRLEHVASVEVPEGTIGVFGLWLSLAPDGSPILLRDQSIQEIYALDIDLP